MHVLISPNTKTGETDLNIISNKYQLTDNLILNNTLGDEKWNQITDLIKKTDSPIMV